MSKDEYKNCPFCDEEIKAIAIKCRYCETFLYENAESIVNKGLTNRGTVQNQFYTTFDDEAHISIKSKGRVFMIITTILGLMLLAYVGYNLHNYFLNGYTEMDAEPIDNFENVEVILAEDIELPLVEQQPEEESIIENFDEIDDFEAEEETIEADQELINDGGQDDDEEGWWVLF